MTIEEIEIIVTAKVEEALKEFEKFLPAIKKVMKQAQEAFSKVDMKEFSRKVNQAGVLIKKKAQEMRKSLENNNIKIRINNEEAQKQITQIEKEIDSLQKKITGRQLRLDITNNTLDKIRNDTNQSVIKEMPEAGNKQIKQETYKRLDENENYSLLVNQSDKLNKEIERYNELLNSAKAKMSELGEQTEQTAITQNKLINLFRVLKPVLSKVTNECQKLGKNFLSLINPLNYVKKIIESITNRLKGSENSVKYGLKNVLKYVAALVSLRSIYSTLSNSASSWLSSQNAGAKQLSANIEYMKYAMGSVFAPIIQYVTSLVYQLMKAIQSVVYAMSGVNIFAKATASSMKNTSSSAKQASKSLSSVHSEINNVSDNKSASSDGTTTPSMDLSQMDNQMSSFGQKLYEFFKPLKESWDNYGSQAIEKLKTTAEQMGGLISSVWKSFENIITNGTAYSILENILAIIGNISEALKNAWQNNGNGDAIVQNLANAFNNLLTAINNVIQSEGFQNWLNDCSDKFRTISEKISEIDWQPMINALSVIGQSVGSLALDILGGLIGIFKWLVENPIVAEIILGIAVAIGVLSTAYGIWSTATGVLTAVSTALDIAILPLVGIIAGIIVAIALIVVAIMNWDTIIRALKDTWDWIKQKAIEIWNAIADFFKNLWQGMCNVVKDIWNGIKEFLSNLWNGILNIVKIVFNAVATFFSNIWNGIKNVVSIVWNAITSTISSVINGIKNIIINVLTTIKNVWNNIWTTIGSVVKNIWNGIWNGIKNIINKILGGIESFVNGTIKGINKLLSGISKVANAVGSFIGLNPISLQISTISLPRLAKGGVLTEATAVVAGEYSGAKSNPEIVTPQNIMRETFEDVLSDFASLDNNDRQINLTINVGNKKLGQILLDDLRDKTRRTGKDIEALIGG